MIVPRNVTDSGCNSCNGRIHVVEFKLGPMTVDGIEGGLLVRLCVDCRRSLLRWLEQDARRPKAPTITLPNGNVLPLSDVFDPKHYQNGADSCACGNLWPCTRMTGPASVRKLKVSKRRTKKRATR